MVEVVTNQPMKATLFHVDGERAAASGGGGIREAVNALQDVGSRLFAGNTEGPSAMLAGVEKAALSAITPQDFMRTSMAATDLSMHVSMSMMKFHLSTSLGSAVTGLFNTLLKNRD